MGQRRSTAPAPGDVGAGTGPADGPPRELLSGTTAFGQPVGRLLLIVAALLVTLGVGLAATFLPALARIDRTMQALEVVLPALESIEPAVTEVRGGVARLEPGLGGLRGDLEGVSSSVADIGDPLLRLEAQLGRLADRLTDLEALPGMETELTGVNDRLDGVRGEVAQIQDVTHGIRGELAGTNRAMLALATALGRLDDGFVEMLELLERMAVHLERIDRKTGPVLLR